MSSKNKKSDSTNIAVILYKSKTLSNGEHPLMLRVTQNRKRKYHSLGKSCQEKFWDSKNNRPKKSHPNFRVLKACISKKLAAYEDQIYELNKDEKDFTPDTLIQTIEKPQRKATVLDFFKEVIERLIASKQVGNAAIYKDTGNCLKKCFKGKDFAFSEIDHSFLIKFETYQRKNGNSENGISVRFRTLRALFNKAIQENIAKVSSYPFDKFKIAKFDTSTRKRALTRENLKEIEALEIDEDSSLYNAQQYFLFSYYSLGINFVDMANLKWENILNDRIFYKRAKTGKELNFKLRDETLKIINYWKPLTGRISDNYVFPILNKTIHNTPTQINNRVHKVITSVNKNLKEIGKRIGLATPLTTYVARHTFATVLKRSGVETAIISQAMGHKTEAITQTYLKSFENDIVDAAQNNL